MSTQVLWSGNVPTRGHMRYIAHRGRHWWQVQTASGWCTTTGEAAYFAVEAA